MSCDRAAQVNAYYDDELPPGRRAAVEAHLRECEPCARLLSDLRGLSRLASAAPLPAVAGLSPDRFYGAWQSSRQRGLLRTSSWLTAAAAAVLFGSLLLRPDARVVEDPKPGNWETVALMAPIEPPDSSADAGEGDDPQAGLVEFAQLMAEDLSAESQQ